MARTTKAAAAASRLQELKNLVEYLGPKLVKRVVIDGIEIEFDTVTAAILARETAEATVPTSEVQQAKDAKGDLAKLLKEEGEDALFWSAGK